MPGPAALRAGIDRTWRPLASEGFWRYAWLLPGTVLTTITAWRWEWFIHPDWSIARVAGHELLSGRALFVYVDHPRAQMGPLALVLAQMPHAVYVPLVAASVGLFLHWGMAAARPGERTIRDVVVALACSLLLVVPWSQLAWKGHADDAGVLLGAAWMFKSIRSGRPARALPGYAVAIASKPTAVVLVPMLYPELMAITGALAITGVVWLPFFLADPAGLLRASRGVMTVAHGSFPTWVGVPIGAAPPGWVRAAQFGLGLLVVAWGAVRRRPELGLLLAVTLRALLDPNPAPAYVISAVALSLIPDVLLGIPLFCSLSAIAFWRSQPVLNGGPGWPRGCALIVLAIALVAALATRRSIPSPRAA